MERLADRLDDRQKLLEAKYARMEAMLSQLDGQRAAIDALVKSMTPVGSATED